MLKFLMTASFGFILVTKSVPVSTFVPIETYPDEEICKTMGAEFFREEYWKCIPDSQSALGWIAEHSVEPNDQ